MPIEQSNVPVTIQRLEEFIRTHEIEDVYDMLQYTYAAEDGKEDPSISGRQRECFTKRVAWRGEPTRELVLRFFNQLNTSFAEKWALANITTTPARFLEKLNRLTLHSQGKRLGIREPIGILKGRITFGERVVGDHLDAYRAIPLLYGIAPRFLTAALGAWYTAVEASERSSDAALCLTMALVAIHPFSDGNGRVARIVYTWLSERWGLPPRWLKEDDKGEFFRTYHPSRRFETTEYFMGEFMATLCDNHNRLPEDNRQSDNDELDAVRALQRQLAGLSLTREVLRTEEFLCLRTHLESYGHFRHSSPRFDSLRGYID